MRAVIQRELRVEARRRINHHLRVGAALVLIGISFIYLLFTRGGSTRGSDLFGALHMGLLACIWTIVPWMAADCISRERREGTLGILFLTPLTAGGIVLAKSLASGLRAISLFVAAVPVLILPFMMGGVTWQEGTFSIIIHLSSFCWALAAAFLATIITKEWVRAMAISAMLSVCFFVVFIMVSASMMLPAIMPGGFGGANRYDELLQGGWFLTTNYEGAWHKVTTSVPGVMNRILPLAGWVFGLSVLFLLGTLGVAALLLKQSWKQQTPSLWLLRWQKMFCTPLVARDFLRRAMRFQLEKNPIGWLEQRSWSGRLVLWGWLAVIITFYGLALMDWAFYRSTFLALQVLLGGILGLSMASTASGSLRRERETRVLELLLVSPLNVRQILHGRILGIYLQFLPAIALWISTGLYIQGAMADYSDYMEDVFITLLVYQVSCFIVLPIIGLFYSLRSANFLVSLFMTVGAGLLFPVFAVSLLPLVDPAMNSTIRQAIALTGVEIVLAIIYRHRLVQHLEGRKFAFHGGNV